MKFPNLPAAGALTGSEIVPLTQGGVDKRTTTQAIADLASGGYVESVNGEMPDTSGEVSLLAIDIPYDPTASGIAATDVQAAIDIVAAGSSGDVVGPASATDDSLARYDGTTGKLLKDGITVAEVRRIPQNSKSAAYTLVLADAGSHIFHPSADTTARIWTIPANSSVAYPVGTALTFVNQNAAGVITIAITTDTMRLAGAGTTGSRTLAANGVATALKVTSTEWIISGTGLT